jgi:hypothetical protein
MTTISPAHIILLDAVSKALSSVPLPPQQAAGMLVDVISWLAVEPAPTSPAERHALACGLADRAYRAALNPPFMEV